MLFLNDKGTTMIEVMIVATILGILASMAIPSYQNFRKNSLQRGAKAHLLGYHRSAKIVIGEFGCNPGNFPAIGFRPEGDIHYRITTVDNSSTSDCNWPPPMYPNDSSCVSTSVTNCCTTAPASCDSDFSSWWNETSTAYWVNSKTAEIKGKNFKVYAFPPFNASNNDPDDVFCVSERPDVFLGDCP